jgi:HSP20 family protein
MIKSLVKKEKGEIQPSLFDAHWPFRDMWDAMSRMERTFSDFFGETRPMMSREMMGVPALDLYRDGDNYVVEASLPGVARGEVNLSATEDSLTISGEHKDSRKIEEKDLFWKEIRHGSFQRTVNFPEPVKADRIKAVYKDGILKVTLPIQEPRKSQKISIEIE